MDSLNQILGDKRFNEPEEFIKLKEFISREYSADATIGMSGKYIVIGVPSSSLASSLRLRLPEIKSSLKISKPIRLRIY